MGKIKEVKEGLRVEKRKGFENFCESLNPNTPYDSICKGVKNFKKKFLNEREFSIPSNKILTDENLFKCFDKISNNYIYDNVNLEGRRGCDSSSILDDAISETEVEVAIKNSKNKSAPGRDLISYLILKALPIKS